MERDELLRLVEEEFEERNKDKVTPNSDDEDAEIDKEDSDEDDEEDEEEDDECVLKGKR